MTVSSILAVANQFRDAVPVQVCDVVVDCKAEAFCNAERRIRTRNHGIVGTLNKVWYRFFFGIPAIQSHELYIRNCLRVIPVERRFAAPYNVGISALVQFSIQRRDQQLAVRQQCIDLLGKSRRFGRPWILAIRIRVELYFSRRISGLHSVQECIYFVGIISIALEHGGIIAEDSVHTVILIEEICIPRCVRQAKFGTPKSGAVYSDNLNSIAFIWSQFLS